MGPPVAFADRDDFKYPLNRPDLDSSGGASGIRRAPSKGTCLASLKRSNFSLNGRLLARHRRAELYALPEVPVCYLRSVVAAIDNRSLDFPYQECPVLHLSRVQPRWQPPGPGSTRQAPTGHRCSSTMQATSGNCLLPAQ